MGKAKGGVRSDCGWYGFTTMLEYKAEWYGRTFIRVAPQYTSQHCSTCGNRNGELTLKDREWTCGSCNAVHDRDVNAATNIRNKALGSTASACEVYSNSRSVAQESLPRPPLSTPPLSRSYGLYISFRS